MAIPDYQSLMFPVLQIISDGKDHTISEASEAAAEALKLSEEERTELLPSGKQRKLVNRVSWAKIYMAKAGLIETVTRGKFKITKRGLDLIQSGVTKIDLNVLGQFPGFVDFLKGNSAAKADSSAEGVSNAERVKQTPQELLDISYKALRDQTAADLLDKLSKVSWQFFEKFVVDVLVAMGYGGSRKDAGTAFRKSGDDGIDGLIKQDPLGLDAVYVQAKKWKDNVGRPHVQAFAGSMEGHRARKGVFITTSQFSSEAHEYVTRIEKKIILIDGHKLADLSIEFGVGVAAEQTYKVTKVDSDYFEEE